MTMQHLTDDELDLVLCGESLPRERQAHLHDCIACRRRRDAFLDAVAQAQAEDPDEVTRTGVREAALAAWQNRPVVHWWRWLVATAAVLMLGVLPLLRPQEGKGPAIDADTVMAEVDAALARDPLAAFASEEVAIEIAPVTEDTGERSSS